MPPLIRASAGYPLRPALAILFARHAGGRELVDLPMSYKSAPAAIAVAVDTTVTWTNNDQLHALRPSVESVGGYAND